MLADLFGCLLHIVELLFVLTFLGGKHTGKFSFTLFKISDVAASDFLDTVINDALIDHVVGLLFPLGG